MYEQPSAEYARMPGLGVNVIYRVCIPWLEDGKVRKKAEGGFPEIGIEESRDGAVVRRHDTLHMPWQSDSAQRASSRSGMRNEIMAWGNRCQAMTVVARDNPN